MTEERKGLDLSKLALTPAPHRAPTKPVERAGGLDEPKAPPKPPLASQPAPVARWPSREAQREVQINIRVAESVAERFKELAYLQRLNHAKLLELLVDLCEPQLGSQRLDSR
jgi:hypothetical protein